MTQDELKSLLSYEPDTGIFRWVNDVGNGKLKATTVAGSIKRTGYVIIWIGGTGYRAHRLAWLYMTGRESTKLIDHINRVKSDNRWENLREATLAENQWNHDLKRSNKSGVSGVHFCNTWKKWKASCNVNGKRYNVGTFKELSDAAKALDDFRKTHHKEFAIQSIKQHLGEA